MLPSTRWPRRPSGSSAPGAGEAACRWLIDGRSVWATLLLDDSSMSESLFYHPRAHPLWADVSYSEAFKSSFIPSTFLEAGDACNSCTSVCRVAEHALCILDVHISRADGESGSITCCDHWPSDGCARVALQNHGVAGTSAAISCAAIAVRSSSASKHVSQNMCPVRPQPKSCILGLYSTAMLQMPQPTRGARALEFGAADRTDFAYFLVRSFASAVGERRQSHAAYRRLRRFDLPAQVSTSATTAVRSTRLPPPQRTSAATATLCTTPPRPPEAYLQPPLAPLLVHRAPAAPRPAVHKGECSQAACARACPA